MPACAANVSATRKSSFEKRRSAASLSNAWMTPIARSPTNSGTKRAARIPIRLANSRSTSGSSMSESSRSLRRRSSTRPLFDAARSSRMPKNSFASSPSAASMRSASSPEGTAITIKLPAATLIQP
jgi:hypothetical protein